MSAPDQDTQALTAILTAYISRTPSSVLEVMARARQIEEKTALERNAGGQAAAHRVLADAVDVAVGGMMDFDKDLIVEVIATHSRQLDTPKWDTSKALLQHLAA